MGNHCDNSMTSRGRRGARQNDYCECNGNEWETAACNECEQCDSCGCAAEYEGERCNIRSKCESCATASGAAVRVGCGNECINGETHVYFESCDGAREVDIISECHNEDSLGRALDVTMKLCNVCPGRRCAVGVQLTEVDGSGNEHARGFRALTVPAHNASKNRDVALPALRFVLPEDVSLAENGGRRHFVVRATNHYMEEPSCGCWKHK